MLGSYTVAPTEAFVPQWRGGWAVSFDTSSGNPNDTGPHELIDPFDPRYPDPFASVRLASFNFYVNVGGAVTITGQNGGPLGKPTRLQLRSAIRAHSSTIEDYRESSLVTLDTVDLSLLLSAVIASPNFSRFNGVLYFDDVTGRPGNLCAFRLINGATLPNLTTPNNPNGGLTLVSPNGVYLQGDFNCGSSPPSDALGATPPTASDFNANGGAESAAFQAFSVGNGYTRVPAAIVCDAFMALSGNWSDANSSLEIPSRPRRTRS